MRGEVSTGAVWRSSCGGIGRKGSACLHTRRVFRLFLRLLIRMDEIRWTRHFVSYACLAAVAVLFAAIVPGQTWGAK